jgi:poly(3-hydroxybutyrate) depolymerase
MREFFVNVPASYDPSKPTRVVFAWHALGGTARQIVGNIFGGPYYGLKSKLTDAIFISAQGLPDTSGTNMGTAGWQNSNGRDVAFARALLAWLDANYCVDKSRIFSIGFSYGAIMTDNLACQLGGALRAVAPVAGGMFGGSRSCVNQRVAAIMTHGSADDQVAISSGMAARDYLMGLAHCTTMSQALGANCVEYTGCDTGYPVAWCQHTGGHTVPSWVATEAATFFMRF